MTTIHETLFVFGINFLFSLSTIALIVIEHYEQKVNQALQSGW